MATSQASPIDKVACVLDAMRLRQKRVGAMPYINGAWGKRKAVPTWKDGADGLSMMACRPNHTYIGMGHTAMFVCATRIGVFGNLDTATRLDCGMEAPNLRPLEDELRDRESGCISL